MTLDRNLVAAALTAYDLGGEIGRGGWGIVLAARHRQLEREVAVKQLPRAFAADPAVRSRFVAEARLLAKLDHPHIVPVYDFVEVEGVCVLVMEKLTGGTVWSRFTSYGLSMDTACAIVLATCSAMECAHAQGILHRDIKPENLLFTASDVLKVTDFGIARMIGGQQTLATRAGEVLGTPAYMAPEQAQAKELTPATDVYAAGVMLYELLSGVLPFPEDADPLTTLYRHAFEPPAPITEVATTVPAEIATVVMKAIATDPAERFPSAEAFGVALAEAATASWGPGWLGRGDLPVMGAAKIMAATERASRPLDGNRGAGTPTHGAAAPGTGTAAPADPVRPAPATEAAVPPIKAAPAPTTPPASPAPSPAPPTERARPRRTSAARPAAPRLEEVDAADLVPVSQVLKRPGSPLPLVLCALALLAMAFVLAMASFGSRHYEAGAGMSVTVNGVPVALGTAVELDLAEPLTLVGTAPAGAPATPTVEVSFSAAGVPLGSSSAPASPGVDGSFTAAVDTTGARYLVAGEVTATVVLRDGDTIVARRSFPVTSTQFPFLTVPGIAGVALVLFVIAYAESLLRSRRRGKKVVSAPVGIAVVGALGGVALAILAWLFGADEPTVATLLTCAAVGAVAGVVATVAAARSAGRRWSRLRGG